MIAFSGVDCAGKSTQVRLVSAELARRGICCKVIHSRAGYTPALEFLKTIVRKGWKGAAREKSEYRDDIHRNPQKRRLLLWLSICDLGLYYGIYFRLVEFLGTTILADRYFWDSYIDFKLKYSDFDFERWLVWRFAKAIHLRPAKSILYTVPASISMYRSSLKRDPWSEPVEMRQRRINKYMAGIQEGKWATVIDASGSIEEVFRQTMECIDE